VLVADFSPAVKIRVRARGLQGLPEEVKSLILESGGQLEIDEQGRFFLISNNITIELHGNHMEVTALWPEAVVHVLSHRTDQPAHWLR